MSKSKQIRKISTKRLINYLAEVGPVDMEHVEDVLTLFLELHRRP